MPETMEPEQEEQAPVAQPAFDAKPWEDVADHFKQTFPGLDADEMRKKYEDVRKLAMARQSAKEMQDLPPALSVATSLAPIATPLLKMREDSEYKAAKERIARGEGVVDGHEVKNMGNLSDHDVVAQYDRRRELEAQRSGAQNVALGLAGGIRFAGEAGIGGLGAEALGAAPAVAGRLGLGAALGLGAGEQAAGKAARSEKEGSRFYSPENIIPAATTQAVTGLLMGGASKWAQGLSSPIKRYLGEIAGGVAGMQGTEVAGGILDEFLKPEWKTDTGYGIAGKVWRGEKGAAIQSATTDVVTMAVLGLMHTGDHKASKEVVDDLNSTLKSQAKKGATPDEAAQAVRDKFKDKLPTVQGKSPFGTDALAQEAASVNGQQTPKPYGKWPDADLVGIAKSLGMKKGETRAEAEGYLKRGGISEDILDQFEEAPKQAQVIQPEKPPAPVNEYGINPIGTGKGLTPEERAKLSQPSETPPPQAPEAVPVAPVEQSPVGKAFTEAFPGAQKHPERNEWKADFGGRTLYALHDPETGNVRIDFAWTGKAPEGAPTSGPKANIPITAQPESKAMLRKLGSFIDNLKEAGTGVEYTAQDGRADVYRRMMERAGFEQATGPVKKTEGTATYSWKPKAPEATPVEAKAPEPIEKALDMPEAAPTDKLRAVFAESGLDAREQFVLAKMGEGLNGPQIAKLKEMGLNSRQRVSQIMNGAREKLQAYLESVGSEHTVESFLKSIRPLDKESNQRDLQEERSSIDQDKPAGYVKRTKGERLSDEWMAYYDKLENHDEFAALSPADVERLKGILGARFKEGPPDESPAQLLRAAHTEANREHIEPPSVRPEDSGLVQPHSASSAEAQAQEVKGSQGIGGSANAGNAEAAGNELRPLPPATQARLNEMVKNGDRVGREDLREALKKHREYSDEEIAQAMKIAGKYPKGVEGPKRPVTLGTWSMQQEGEYRKYNVAQQLASEIAEHLDPKEHADVIQNVKREGSPESEAAGLVEQAVSKGQSEGISEGRVAGIEGVAQETGHDPKQLGELLEASPTDIPFNNQFRREPGTAEPITGGQGFGRPVSPAERAGVVLGGGQEGPETERPKTYTALANAKIDQERAASGKPPLMSEARQSNPEIWDKAMARLEKDPEAGAKLVEELSKKSRTTTAEENALLLHRKIALSNELERAALDTIRAFNDKADAITIAETEARYDEMSGKVEQLDRVARDTGTEWGRAGQFRRQLAAEDFSLGKMLMEATAAKGRPLTPEERLQIAQQAQKIEDLQKRLDAAEAMLKGQKMGTKGWKDWNDARAALRKETGSWQDSIKGDRDANRPFVAKMEDWLVKMRRAFVISSPTTMAKIVAASAERLGIAPIEEAVGGAISQIPGMQKIAALAAREGGFNAKIEARAIASSWGQGLVDAWQIAKTGKSELDVLYGKSYGPRSWLDWVGELHAAGKAPAVRAEFTRSFLKRVDSAIEAGQDATGPAAMLRIGTEAYKDSQRAKFQQDNRLVDKINQFLTAKQDAGAIERAATTVGKVMLPIVRIPTNLVIETATYAFGLGTGSVRLGAAMSKGIENMKPGEADIIMRSLKKGTLGAAALALGYFNPQMFGGFYSGKRKEDDVATGGMKTPLGTVPSWALHNPLLEVLQMGATIRRAADKSVKGERSGELQGIGAGLAGLAEELPMVREAEQGVGLTSHNAKERGWHFGEMLKSLAVPQAVQWLAGKTDQNAKGEPTKRKPVGVMQHIEMGVPGLRQTVPAK